MYALGGGAFTPYSYDHAGVALGSRENSAPSSLIADGGYSTDGARGGGAHAATMSPLYSLSPALFGSITSAGGVSSTSPEDDPSTPPPGLGLKAILFAEFDNIHGPQVVHQWPENFVSDQPGNTAKEIGLYGTYLIPHEALSGHVCVWTHGTWTYLTYPETFEDAKFFRNQYRTNLIFVFDAGRVEIEPFRSIIRRVSQAFQILERDFEWLSRQSKTAPLKAARTDADIPPTPNRGTAAGAAGAAVPEDAAAAAAGPAPTEADAAAAEDAEAPAAAPSSSIGDMPPITTVLRRLVEGLNTNHEAVVDFGVNNGVILSFKYFSPMPAPPEIDPWDVPVLIHLPSDDDISEMDLALQWILPRIDNVRSVAVIANVLGMPVASCCVAVRHLAYHGIIKVIDIFQNSNIYTLAPSPFAAFSTTVAGTPLDWTCRYCSRDVNDPISLVALLSFFQAFGCQPLDPGARSDAGLAGLKRVEAVLRYFDDLPGANAVYTGRHGAGASEKAKLEKFRSEWRDELRKKLSVRHAIAFGVFSGFLKRVHEIPVYDSHKASKAPDDRRRLQETEEFKPLYDILAGANGRSVDDICLTLTLTTRRPWARADIMAFEKCCNILLK
eukprot:TRINITY_DN22438_c0_g1_i1.p2 TRINITY_DN22438_c0_g1~~TRINITY_DN22438_c0_g1_i1.p2  ORF type:complete len:611 (+),score=238.83 TRINITY_DN22438_c0_g1_i1:93-1925(+)